MAFLVGTKREDLSFKRRLRDKFTNFHLFTKKKIPFSKLTFKSDFTARSVALKSSFGGILK